MDRNKKILLLVISLIIAFSILYAVSRLFVIFRPTSVKPSLGQRAISYDLVREIMPTLENNISAPAAKVVSGKIADSSGSDSSGGAVSANSTVDRLIIKSGQFSLVVKDVASTSQSIINYAVAKGGFLVSKNISKSSDNKSYSGTVVVRVPAKEFDNSIGEYKKFGEVKSQSITGQDVTEDYVDTQAQLKNLKAAETQFLEILKKAYTIKDILLVQTELTTVRDKIERLEGYKKYLEQSASLSSVTVYLSTDSEFLPVVGQDNSWKPVKVLKEALRGLLAVGKSLSYGIIWFVVYLPLLALSVLVIWIIYKLLKRRQLRNSNK